MSMTLMYNFNKQARNQTDNQTSKHAIPLMIQKYRSSSII